MTCKPRWHSVTLSLIGTLPGISRLKYHYHLNTTCWGQTCCACSELLHQSSSCCVSDPRHTQELHQHHYVQIVCMRTCMCVCTATWWLFQILACVFMLCTLLPNIKGILYSHHRSKWIKYSSWTFLVNTLWNSLRTKEHKTDQSKWLPHGGLNLESYSKYK